MNSLSRFFWVSAIDGEISDLGTGRWLFLGFLIWVGRILPLLKSSSAGVRLEVVQKVKSKEGDRRNWSDLLGSDSIELISDDGSSRSWEKEILGLMETSETEQTSTAIDGFLNGKLL